MNKKGNMFVMGFITLTVLALIIGAVTVPQARNLYSTPPYSESLTLNTGGTETTYNMSAFTSVVNSSGSTLPATNYSVDLATDTVTLLDTDEQANNTAYTVSYYYYPGTYLGSASDRTVASVIVVAVIVGLAYLGLRLFNLV